MQHLKVSGAVRPLKWSLGVKWLIVWATAIRQRMWATIQLYTSSLWVR